MRHSPLTLVGLGDSLTQGIGDEFGLGFLGRVAQHLLQSREVSLYNLGVRGHTSLDLSRRVAAEMDARLSPGASAVFLLCIGTNDAAHYRGKARVPVARSLELVRRILVQLHSRGKVFWIGPVPIAESPLSFEPSAGELFDFHPDRSWQLSEAYGKLASEEAVPYLNLHQIFHDSSLSLGERSDGIHPRAAGYQMLSEQILSWPDFRKALGLESES